MIPYILYSFKGCLVFLLQKFFSDAANPKLELHLYKYEEMNKTVISNQTVHTQKYKLIYL